MSIPSKTELERFFGSENADDVKFVETVASWPSLRILEFLYVEGPSSTGDIARELNMDMRDIRDRLEALEDTGVVLRKQDRWETATDRVTITLEKSDGIEISHSLEEELAPVDSRHDKRQAGGDGIEEDTDGFFGRLIQRVESLFRY
jgi:DNA-binding MarR family transcriptional regulator